MDDKKTFILAHAQARSNAIECVRNAPEGAKVEVSDASRSLDQNAYQWPYLQGFSEQILWPVNGEMVKMSSEEWKDVLTSAFEAEVKPRLAMGFEGSGMVMLGRRTSKFGKKKFALWMEWLMAAAALKGVEPVFKNGHKRWEGGYEH